MTEGFDFIFRRNILKYEKPKEGVAMKTRIGTNFLRIFVTLISIIFLTGFFSDLSLAGGKGKSGGKSTNTSTSAGSCPASGGDGKAKETRVATP